LWRPNDLTGPADAAASPTRSTPPKALEKHSQRRTLPNPASEATGQRSPRCWPLAAQRLTLQPSVADSSTRSCSPPPQAIRDRFHSAGRRRTVSVAERLRTHPSHDHETTAAITALRSVARRIRALDAEALAHEHAVRTIITAWRPDLLDQLGVGTIVAATILCAWSHPGRFRSEAAFASLAGTGPLDASSGRQIRHRLNREGDRQLNRAFYTIVISRLHYDPATREYARRRTAEGRTGPEIRRCLQRYITREIFRLLEHPTTP
jgi:hypothetical protein